MRLAQSRCSGVCSVSDYGPTGRALQEESLTKCTTWGGTSTSLTGPQGGVSSRKSHPAGPLAGGASTMDLPPSSALPAEREVGKSTDALAGSAGGPAANSVHRAPQQTASTVEPRKTASDPGDKGGGGAKLRCPSPQEGNKAAELVREGQK